LFKKKKKKKKMVAFPPLSLHKEGVVAPHLERGGSYHRELAV
jgi:hypothetical protein